MDDFEKALRETIKMCNLIIRADRLDINEFRKKAMDLKAETEKSLAEYLEMHNIIENCRAEIASHLNK